MKYYRVKEEHDNKPRYILGKGKNAGKIIRDGILIANELYTEKEREKLLNKDLFFDLVEVSRKDIVFFFGARFECK